MSSARLAGVSVLVVEDESLLRKRYAAHLESEGAEVSAVGSLREATEALAGLDFDVVLLDVNLPDGRGTDLLRGQRLGPSTSAVVMTATGGVNGAVEAMRLGAVDYLTKPCELDDLALRVMRARRSQNARRADEFRRGGAGAKTDEAFVFGPSLAGVESLLKKIIAADEHRLTSLPPVLIEGETGTGKTTIARWLHAHGPRANGPLIEVNCSALPEALAESELFGHERGAFTDARNARIGLMEAADGGTLFLDELPSLSPSLQAKLLTAIDDHRIRRVGANKPKHVDVRVVAATNADLRQLVAEGKFREDLLHRLDLFRVRIPPLRERGDDIVALATALLARIAPRYGLDVPLIPAEGRARLRAHTWPGNVRELSHVIERTLVFEGPDGLRFTTLAPNPTATAASGSSTTGEHVATSALATSALATSAPALPALDSAYIFPEQGFSLEATIQSLVQRALDQSNGNVSAAARLLGVTRDYVRYHLKEPPSSAAPSA